jgi:hypothetical protein
MMIGRHNQPKKMKMKVYHTSSCFALIYLMSVDAFKQHHPHSLFGATLMMKQESGYSFARFLCGFFSASVCVCVMFDFCVFSPLVFLHTHKKHWYRDQYGKRGTCP